MEIQVIGLVRFSYISKNGFRKVFDTVDESRAYLFEAKRMAFRLKMLEKICIHAMRHQTDMDFQLIILASLSLPSVYLNRIKEIIAPLKGAQLVLEPPKWMVQVTQTSFKSLINRESDYVINFRLDDDDAVAIDYIASLRRIGRQLIAGGLAQEPTVIAHSKGIYWDLDKGEDGFRPVTEVRPLGLACAMITRPDLPASVFRWNHRDMGGYFPVFLLPSAPMFLRSLHSGGDSGANARKWEASSGKTDMAAILQTRFCLNVEDLTAGWKG